MCWYVGLFDSIRDQGRQVNLFKICIGHPAHPLSLMRSCLPHITKLTFTKVHFNGIRRALSRRQRHLSRRVHVEVTLQCEATRWLLLQDGQIFRKTWLGILKPVCDWLQVRLQQRSTLRVTSSPNHFREVLIVPQWIYFKLLRAGRGLIDWLTSHRITDRWEDCERWLALRLSHQERMWDKVVWYMAISYIRKR